MSRPSRPFVRKLSPEQKARIEQLHLEGLERAVIVERLGVSADAIKRTLRAMRKREWEVSPR